MSIIISDVSYRHPNRDFLFEHLNFAVAKQRKVENVINDKLCSALIYNLPLKAYIKHGLLNIPLYYSFLFDELIKNSW